MEKYHNPLVGQGESIFHIQMGNNIISMSFENTNVRRATSDMVCMKNLE